MFERYTEKARRVIFFARYEASQFGQPNIETEHLLLGILREDKALTNRFLRSYDPAESIRKQIEEQTTIRESVSTSVDMPLSNESKRVLAYGAEEAERLAQKNIGPEHLLLGLLREGGCFAAAILKERGLEIEKVREDLAITPHRPASEPGVAPPSLTVDVRDLILAASNGELEPVVGRDRELEAVMEILLSRHKSNPMLVGERGCGKTALVEGLAQRIAAGTAPAWFSDRRILAIDPESLLDRSAERASGRGSEADASKAAAMRLLETLLERLVLAANKSVVLLFLDDLCDVLTVQDNAAHGQFGLLLKTCLLREQVQCIASATPERWRKAVLAAPWLEQCFRTVAVGAMDAEQTLAVLHSRRQFYEKHHGVAIDEAALECAARSAGRYLHDGALPGKALELIDAAAAHMNLNADGRLDEVHEAKKRLRFILKRMEDAVVNHEFEKARFYSEEERKEREKLRTAEEQSGLKSDPKRVVGVAEVEAVIGRWGGYPYRAE